MGGFVKSLIAAPRASSGGSSGIATPEKWVEEWFAGGDATAAGMFITPDTAMHYAPFFAGINAISSDIGKLPLPLYRRLDKGRTRAVEHPLYPVLHDEPNPLLPPLVLRRQVQSHALAWGDGYANIVRNGAGNVVELWPLRPDRIKAEPKWTGAGRFELMYRYNDEVNGIRTMLFPDEVLHIGGLGFNGIRGYSLVSYARQAIGLGLATERFGAAFFGNGARPGGFLKHPKRLSEEGHKRLKADWENQHRGLDRAQRIAILEEGVEWQDVGIPPEDAQFLETRKFQVSEMARWLRMPPHKLADLERGTFSNIEHQSIEYVTDTLGMWLVLWEQSLNMRVLTKPEKRVYFAEHVVDALLRGDINARYKAYAIGRNWGWLSADDVREKENLNPLPDGQGQVYLMPTNMQPADAPEAEPRELYR